MWLAERVGKDPAEVSRYVSRGMIPDVATREAIATALNREPSELWPDLYEAAA